MLLEAKDRQRHKQSTEKQLTQSLICSYRRKTEACSRGRDLSLPAGCAQGRHSPAWISNHTQSEGVVR